MTTGLFFITFAPNLYIMDIRQLKFFVGVAEYGSFSEASRTFFISQSAISQTIKALEDELNTTLFTRTSHKVMLTESGKMLLPLARKVLNGVEECQNIMADINNVLRGELNIGLTHSLEPYVTRAMARFMRLYPNVMLNVKYCTIPELIHQLRNGELDLAFSIKVEGEEDWVDSTPVMSYKLCAIMRDTHSLASRSELTFKDLELQPLVLPESSQRSHNAVESFLNKEGNNLRVRAVVDSPWAILNLLRHTNCICILSEHTVRGNEDLTSVPIRELAAPVTTYAHMRKDGHRKKSAETFLDLLQAR